MPLTALWPRPDRFNMIDPNFKFAKASGDRKSMSGRQETMKNTETMVEQIPLLLKELGCVSVSVLVSVSV